MANEQTRDQNDFGKNRVIVTALLMLQPHWSQKLITQALDINKSFISKAKMQAIKCGYMDNKQTPTAEGMEYLEWAKMQFDIFAYVKKVKQFSSNMNAR